MTQTEGTFKGWVILELLGHRKLGGYLTEQTIAGTQYLRLDVMGSDSQIAVTQFYSPNSVYCITPVREDIAQQYGLTHQPTPVTRWELPAVEDLHEYPD